MTKEEFQAKVLPAVAAEVEARKRKSPSLYRGGPYLSMDNAKPHNGGLEALQKCSTLNWRQLPLPPLSHDMHKVIEHIINRIKYNTNKAVLENTAITTNEQVRKEIKEQALALPKKGIQDDIKSLLGTYNVISKPVCRGGTGGDWAPKGLR